jgi:RNA polymerase sigma factor (sigma-70 family)
MSSDVYGASTRYIHTLLKVGVVGGLTDGELLEMFKARRGDSAEWAFAAIVDRHGPMVQRVCRQVLGNSHDADDAFQATFLILVHKAGLVSLGDSLGPWLHGVALRVASCARSAKARRRVHEQRAGEARNPFERQEIWDDLGAVLHEEIQQLPERYRNPVVLCWLEGFSTEAAGQRLRCPQGTILSRLSRARERLRKRLTRRGVTLAGGALGMASFTEAAPAAVPEALVGSTIQIASRALSGSGTGSVSAAVATLTKRVLTTMLLTKMKTAAALLLSVGAVITGAAVVAQQDSAPSPKGVARRQAETRRAEVDPGPTAASVALQTETKRAEVDPGSTAASLERTAREFEQLADRLERQARALNDALGREPNPRRERLVGHLRDQLSKLESEVRKAQEHIAGWVGPETRRPVQDVKLAPKGAPDLPKGPSFDDYAVGERPRETQSELDDGEAPAAPTLRWGGYIFTASPLGNKVVAYNPASREVKSVQLNATREQPLKIAFVVRNNENGVALRLQGPRITRVAVFDFRNGRWLPLDLAEPVAGEVRPATVGGGGIGYDLDRHFYTLNLGKGTWDHLDIRTITDDVEETEGWKESATRKEARSVEVRKEP